MKSFLIILLLFFYENALSQKTFSGIITNENDFLLTSVLVINITQNKQIYSNAEGRFFIEASVNDEIRFIKDKYERISIKITQDKNTDNQHIKLIPIPEKIEEVKIIKLTKRLSKVNKKG